MRIFGRIDGFAALLVCAGLPQAALAAKWLEVGAATNGVKIFVDADSLTVGKGWVRLDQRFVFPKAGRHTLSRVDQQVAYNCGNRTVRPLSSLEYDRAGRVSRVEIGTPPYRVAPGTLLQYVFDLVC